MEPVNHPIVPCLKCRPQVHETYIIKCFWLLRSGAVYNTVTNNIKRLKAPMIGMLHFLLCAENFFACFFHCCLALISSHSCHGSFLWLIPQLEGHVVRALLEAISSPAPPSPSPSLPEGTWPHSGLCVWMCVCVCVCFLLVWEICFITRLYFLSSMEPFSFSFFFWWGL